MALEHFDIIWSVSVEYMHCCLQGAGKQVLTLLTKPKYSNTDHYIVPAKQKLLNKRLVAIRPTSSIVRKPRSLTQLANFKASEIRSMFLYYLPVCLPGCVPKIYVEHVRQLSTALYILLQQDISFEDVDTAESILKNFVKQHQKLFGKQSMVMVIHLLKHLAQSVHKLGPLWCHSAFQFERNNGCLLKLVSGTTDVIHQISSKYSLGKSVNKHRPANKASDSILLGKAESFIETAGYVFDAISLEMIDFGDVQLLVHKRIKLNQKIYTSVLYTRPKRSVDYFIGLSNGRVGSAKYYLSHKGEICVMLKEFHIIGSVVPHIQQVVPTNRLILTPIADIEKKFILMTVGLNSYITCRPNPYENE